MINFICTQILKSQHVCFSSLTFCDMFLTVVWCSWWKHASWCHTNTCWSTDGGMSAACKLWISRCTVAPLPFLCLHITSPASTWLWTASGWSEQHRYRSAQERPRSSSTDLHSEPRQDASWFRCRVVGTVRRMWSGTPHWTVKGGGGDSSSSLSCSSLSLIQGKSFSSDFIKWWKAVDPRLGKISSSFNVLFLLDDSDWISCKWLSVKISSWYKYCMIKPSTKSSSDRKSRWDWSSFLCFGSIFEPGDRVKKPLCAGC